MSDFIPNPRPRPEDIAASQQREDQRLKQRASANVANESASTNAELLTKIQASATDNSSPPHQRLADALASFSSLFCNISNQADKQAGTIIRLTKWLIGLTVLLGALTIGLLVATLILLEVARHTDEQVRQIYKIAEVHRSKTEKTNTSITEVNGIGR